jgi:hypothetical protein
MHRTEGKTMAIQKALETLCYVHGCGWVAIESAQIHFETGGGVARQLLDSSSLYDSDAQPDASAAATSPANTTMYSPAAFYTAGVAATCAMLARSSTRTT